jgi:hypothetical protein
MCACVIVKKAPLGSANAERKEKREVAVIQYFYCMELSFQ